jgi:hypothetical protein
MILSTQRFSRFAGVATAKKKNKSFEVEFVSELGVSGVFKES